MADLGNAVEPQAPSERSQPSKAEPASNNFRNLPAHPQDAFSNPAQGSGHGAAEALLQYRGQMLSPQALDLQNLASLLAAQQSLKAGAGPQPNGVGSWGPEGIGQASGHAYPWHGQLPEQQHLQQHMPGMHEALSFSQGFPDQAPRSQTPGLASAQYISRPPSAGFARTPSPAGAKHSVDFQIPKLDVGGGYANGAPQVNGRRSPFAGFWPAAQAAQHVPETAALPANLPAPVLSQWLQSAPGDASVARALQDWQAQLALQQGHAAPQAPMAPPYALSGSWQRTAWQGREPYNGARPPLSQQQWAGAGGPSAFAGFHPAPAPQAVAARLPDSLSARAGQAAAAAGAGHDQLAGWRSLPLRPEAAAPAPDAWPQAWQGRRPLPSVFSAGVPSRAQDDGGAPVPREPRRPDAQWLQSLPSLASMSQRAAGTIREAALAGQPQPQPQPQPLAPVIRMPRANSPEAAEQPAMHGAAPVGNSAAAAAASSSREAQPSGPGVSAATASALPSAQAARVLAPAAVPDLAAKTTPGQAAVWDSDSMPAATASAEAEAPRTASEASMPAATADATPSTSVLDAQRARSQVAAQFHAPTLPRAPSPEDAASEPRPSSAAAAAAATGTAHAVSSAGRVSEGAKPSQAPGGQGAASTAEDAGPGRPASAFAAAAAQSPTGGACESERGGVPGESAEERAAFFQSLRRHWQQEAREDFVQNRWSVPVTGYKQVDLAALYRLVGLHGGHEMVSEKKWWRNIGTLLGHAPSSKMKAIYEKFLGSYADRYYDAKRFTEGVATLYLRGSYIKAQERELMEQLRWKEEKAKRAQVAPNGVTQPPPSQPVYHPNHQVLSHTGQQSTMMHQQQALQGMLPHASPAQLQHMKQLLAERQAYAQRHAAAQQSQLEQTRHVALNRITPSPSPFMLVPQTLAPEQVRELIMALKSGLPDTVPWALNALALSSFCARPELPALPSLPGLLPVLLQVLADGAGGAAEAEAAAVAAANAALEEDEWPGLRPPRKRQKGTPPGQPKGWWWERAGILSDGGREDERFTWAVCAAAILRNLAASRANLGTLAEPQCIGLLVEVLEARNREQSAGYNELALSLMDVLGAVAHGGCLSAQHHVASLFRLVLALGKLLRHRQPPLRLRAAAADLLAKLAASKQLSAVMLPCLEKAELRLTVLLVNLLLVDLEAAREAVRGEVQGDIGPPEVPPDDVSPEALQQAAVVLQAEAVSAAAAALAGLWALAASHKGQKGLTASLLDADARAVPALVAVLLGRHPEQPLGLPETTTASPVVALGAQTAALLKQAAEHAAVAMWHVAASQSGREQLGAFTGQLAPAAMSAHPHSSHLAHVLARLSRSDA